jgi:hypothetical protein
MRCCSRLCGRKTRVLGTNGGMVLLCSMGCWERFFGPQAKGVKRPVALSQFRIYERLRHDRIGYFLTNKHSRGEGLHGKEMAAASGNFKQVSKLRWVSLRSVIPRWRVRVSIENETRGRGHV